MQPSLYDASLRVKDFLDAWDKVHPGNDLIYAVGAFPGETEPRPMLAGDLRVLLDAVATP